MDTIGKQYSLPEDIIIDILLVLPVKSLLRCESVCKQWCAIIGSSTFINKHFHHESNYTRLLIFRRHNHSLGKPSDPEDNTFALFLDEALQIREQPKRSHIPYAIRSLHGPCKGVFCIRNSNHQLALWNTATRRLRVLPPFPSHLNKTAFFSIGFGIDPLTDEFKVVVIHRFHYARVPQFSIYTSKTDSWRCFENKTILDVHDFVADPEHGTTFLNGFYYWRKRIDLRESFLLAMDMHNEVFQEIQLPCSLRRGTINLHLCNESIVAFGRFGEFEVWIMKEKGYWTKLCDLHLPFSYIDTLGFSMNINEIFVLSKFFDLVLYDIDSQAKRVVKFKKKGGGRYMSWPFHYKESLFSVKEGYKFDDYDVQSADSQEFFSKTTR